VITLEEIEKKVKTKEEQFSKRFDRMDKDYDLWNLKPRVFDSHKRYINVTTNAARTLVNKVQASLVAVPIQIQVKVSNPLPTEDIKEQTNRLERLFRFALDKADLRLRRQALPPLRDSVVWHLLVRGWGMVRTLVYREKEEVVFDLLPIDPRNVTFATDSQGLSWINIRTYRSPESLENDYGYEIKTSKSQLGIEVNEYWDDSINCVSVKWDEFLKKPKKYNLSRIPIVIVPVPIAPPVVSNSETLVEGYGEAIFAPNRLEYELNDRLLSLGTTHADLVAKQPLINYYRPGVGKELDEPTWVPGGSINVQMDANRLEPYPIKDIPQSLAIFISQTQQRIQQGGLAAVESGLYTPPASGTALSILRETTDKTIGPYLRALTYLYSDICRLMHEQIIHGGYSVPVATIEGNDFYRYTIEPVELLNDYFLKVNFAARTPWAELENYQIAEMALRNGLVSKDTIREDIIKVDDSKVEEVKVLMEKIIEQNPLINLYKSIETLVKLGRNQEAAILGQQLQQIIIQTQKALQVPPEQGQSIQGGK